MAREVIEKKVLRERKRIRGLDRGRAVSNFDMRCDAGIHLVAGGWGVGMQMETSVDT